MREGALLFPGTKSEHSNMPRCVLLHALQDQALRSSLVDLSSSCGQQPGEQNTAPAATVQCRWPGWAPMTLRTATPPEGSEPHHGSARSRGPLLIYFICLLLFVSQHHGEGEGVDLIRNKAPNCLPSPRRPQVGVEYEDCVHGSPSLPGMATLQSRNPCHHVVVSCCLAKLGHERARRSLT